MRRRCPRPIDSDRTVLALRVAALPSAGAAVAGHLGLVARMPAARHLGGAAGIAQHMHAHRAGAAARMASLLDLLDAERSYRETELNYRQTLASYMTAVEQLKEAVGTRRLP